MSGLRIVCSYALQLPFFQEDQSVFGESGEAGPQRQLLLIHIEAGCEEKK